MGSPESCVAPPAAVRPDGGAVVNDFSIQVATANGSGSQSSNTVLLRAIFQMGVPVSGKNLFPSNIAGLPTWYTIRASRDGWIARKEEIDLLVAMNPETARDDVLGLAPAQWWCTTRRSRSTRSRDDLVFYPVAVRHARRAAREGAEAPQAAAQHGVRRGPRRLLSIDMARDGARHARSSSRASRRRADLNFAAARAGFEHAATIEKRDPLVVRRMDATAGKVLVDGNAAAAMGALFAGVTVVSWYPITPSSSLVETLIGYLQQVPDRSRRQGDVRRRPGRGRARCGGDGNRRGLGRRAGDDRDRRAGRLAS